MKSFVEFVNLKQCVLSVLLPAVVVVGMMTLPSNAESIAQITKSSEVKKSPENKAAAPTETSQTSEVKIKTVNTSPPSKPVPGTRREEEKADKSATAMPAGLDKVDFFNLAILTGWLLCNVWSLKYINSKRRLDFVRANHEYLNLAAIFAGLPVILLMFIKVSFIPKFKEFLINLKFGRKNVDITIFDFRGEAIFGGNNGRGGEFVGYVKNMLAEAAVLNASDIFIDPKNSSSFIIRFRVDGSLRQIDELDRESGEKVVNVLKVASGMDVAEQRRPQDGSFSMMMNGSNISLRAASVGAMSGEKIALRLLGGDKGPHSLKEAGVSGDDLILLENAPRLPSGMVLICGPTGSGKTTTLYAMLNCIDYGVKNVISIEDPIEHVVPMVSQMEVNVQAGITFSQLLRNALRQNPDIICLGEIRDEDTAQVAVNAAQTGHLIIATLHSNDNINTIDRLANLGVPLRSIAGTLQVVVSQRLVRKLCECKKPVEISPEELEKFRQYGIEPGTVYTSVGCKKCGNTGFLGRVAVFDILRVDSKLRAMLEDEHTNLSNLQMKLESATNGSVMLQAGYRLAGQGIIPLNEIKRVIVE